MTRQCPFVTSDDRIIFLTIRIRSLINTDHLWEVHKAIFLFCRYLGKHESLWNEEKLTLASDYVRRHKNGIQYSKYYPTLEALSTNCRLPSSFNSYAAFFGINSHIAAFMSNKAATTQQRQVCHFSISTDL